MTETIRCRLSFPKEDDIVNDFLKNQTNKSASIRILIKAYVNSYGVNDVISQYPDIDFSDGNLAKESVKKTKSKRKPIRSMTFKDIENLESSGIVKNSEEASDDNKENNQENEVLDGFNEEDLFNLKPNKNKNENSNSSDDILKQLRRG